MRFSLTNPITLAKIPLLIFSLTALQSLGQSTLQTQTLLSTGGQPSGGDGVAISGDWGFVGDADRCQVNVYKYDFVTDLWGDGAGNRDVPHSVLSEGPCNKAAFRSYGASISTTSGLLIVGAPLAKSGQPEHGKIFFYTYDSGSDSWVLEPTIGNPEDPAGSSDLQNGALFGQKVSVRRTGILDQSALVLVGSPGYDGPSGTDSGKVYVYRWNDITGQLTFLRTINGLNAGDLLGTSLTSNGQDYLVGFPGFGSSNEGGVGLFLDDGSGDFLPVEIYPGAPGDAAGQEVSLGSRDDGLMLFSGANTYVYSCINPGCAPVSGGPSYTQDLVLAGSGGGDVSQGDQVAGFGFVGSSVEFYRDKTAINGTADLVIPAEPGATEYGRDISFSGARVVVNGNTNDEAYSYYQVCAGGTLNHREWTMIGLPCEASNPIGVIFDELGTYGSEWVMYRQQDSSDPSSPDYSGGSGVYLRMEGAETMEQGRGYWIIADTGGTGTSKRWDITGTLGSTITTTPTTTDDLAAGPRPDVAGVFTYNLASLMGTGYAPLDDARVMLSNPFPQPIDWSMSSIEDDATNTYNVVTLPEADQWFEGGDISAYVYDATANGGTGGYTAVSASTPGFPREIDTTEGFFVRFSNTFSTEITLPLQLRMARRK